MTDTPSIEELKAELDSLKAEQERRDLEAEIKQLKEETPDKQISASDVKLAAVRQGLCGVMHFIGGPFASLYYGARTGHWAAPLCATGVAVVALPFAIVDFGLTFAVAPPTLSAALLISASSEKRRKLGITGPEQADALMAKVTRF
jgi:VIT1/CCC1 family predicted Fe2+/Mn2+ transporter